MQIVWYWKYFQEMWSLLPIKTRNTSYDECHWVDGCSSDRELDHFADHTFAWAYEIRSTIWVKENRMNELLMRKAAHFCRSRDRWRTFKCRAAWKRRWWCGDQSKSKTLNDSIKQNRRSASAAFGSIYLWSIDRWCSRKLPNANTKNVYTLRVTCDIREMVSIGNGAPMIITLVITIIIKNNTIYHFVKTYTKQ